MEEEKKRKECKKCGDELVIDETPKIKVNGKDVGIADLDNIMSEVIALNLSDDAHISKELLQRVKDRDFVPSSVEKEYSRALLEEYKQRI
jgi:predicted Mrr-cat superfamily restriction endonuclease